MAGPERDSGGTSDVRSRCFRLDATPAEPGSLPLALTVEFPVPPAVPRPHGGALVDGAWTSDRTVWGLNHGAARFTWVDGGRVRLDLVPLPADVGVQFVGQTEYDSAGVSGWRGAWLRVRMGAPDTVGTFTLTPLHRGPPCSPPAP